MYRVSLGRKTVGSNLVNLSPGTSGTYSNLLVPGKWYRIEFTKSNDELIFITTGALKTNQYQGIDGTITADRLVVSGNEFKLEPAGGGTTFSSVSIYELGWNDPLETDPIGWGNLKTGIVKDKTLNGLITRYTTELTFIGDGYDYLKGILDDNGFCATVPVLIEERCSENDVWSTYFEGQISLSDDNVEVDLERCEIKTQIKDRGAVETVSKGRNVKVAVLTDAGNTVYGGITPVNFLELHDASGNHGGTHYDVAGFTVQGMFEHILAQISEGGINFESDFFSTGDFYKLIITNAAIFIDQDPGNLIHPKISFNELFTELDKFFNLSFSITYSGNIPTLRIEPKSYFEDAVSVLTLTYVPGIKFKIDKESLYRTVIVGTKRTYISDDSEGVQYASEFGCTGDELNLLSDFVVDSGVIKDLLNPVSTGPNVYARSIYDYANNLFLIEADPDISDPDDNALSRVYNVGDYNGLLTPEKSMERRFETLTANNYTNTGRSSSFTKTTTPKVKEYSFSFPLTKAQFNAIDNPMQTVTFSGSGVPAPLTGYILEAEREEKTGLTKFKLLA